MEGAGGFWGGNGGYNATDGHYERRERLYAIKGHTKGSTMCVRCSVRRAILDQGGGGEIDFKGLVNYIPKLRHD